MKYIITASLIGLITSFQMAFAHGTNHRIVEQTKTITVEFYYSDNEPMSYAEVVVFSPMDPNIQFQTGRTDKNGRFAFCPDRGGIWHVEVSDGMGHKAAATIEVHNLGQRTYPTDVSEALKGQKAETIKDRILKVIMGLSIIGNFAFLILFFKRRKERIVKY